MAVIDFHMHIALPEECSPTFLKWLSSKSKFDIIAEMHRVLDTPHLMLQYLDDQGVDYAICLAETNPLTAAVAPNERVAEFCSSSPRLIPFANINPFVVAKPGDAVEQCVKLGHRGLKLYPSYQHFYPNNRRLYPLYHKAQDMGVPIMFHTGTSTFPGSRTKYSDPLFLDDVAVEFPDLILIMAHSGRSFWYDRAFSLARIHKNLYLEISGLPPKKLPFYFPDLEKLADKVIFGSDWPDIRDTAVNIAAIRSLPFADDTKEKILGLNAARILGIR